ncbi:MAG: RHS repeat-associated core domain-containing protein [Opitutales bacterium]|nr:RHS repeat-associated core domain-containing protein [Opitutales bacterium]
MVLRNYTYDVLGRPLTRSTSRNGTTRNDTFGYNARSELTSATLGSDNYAYAFDHIGNRATEAIAIANSESQISNYSANNLNQYTDISLGEAVSSPLQYDADGNATLVQTSTETWQITYNGENRPIRFRNEETDTTVECGYDSQGRRFEKKVTVAGTTTLHHRYIYRGYLQIAALDLKRSAHPALWLVTWDPSQPTATRPLAIQKDGTWFTYGYDITKNICEVFGQHGYIRTAYSYAPFGSVSASGDVSQPLQWSSEHYDSELDLIYYNYRHYSPSLGRFLSRDPIAEQGGLNLYVYAGNTTRNDRLGLLVCCEDGKVAPEVEDDPGRKCCKSQLITVGIRNQRTDYSEFFQGVGHTYIFIDEGEGEGWGFSVPGWGWGNLGSMLGGEGFVGGEPIDTPHHPELTYTYKGCPETIEKLRKAIVQTKLDRPTYNFINISGKNCSGMACYWMEEAGFVAPFNPSTPFLVPVGNSGGKKYGPGRNPAIGGKAGW